jgi:acetyl esterase/lipase
MPVVYRLPGTDAVEVRENLTYRKLAGAELAMDLYSPPGSGPGAKRPAVVFVHGGPIPAPPVLQPKDWRDYRDFGRLAAVSGFIGVTFNHRFYGSDRIFDAQDDIEELVRFVREESDALGIDAERLALWAFSGGGIFLSELIRHPAAFIRGLIGFYTVMDLRSFPTADPSRAVDRDTLARFSPVAALDEASGSVPPILIARAGLDLPLLNGSIDRFAESALTKNLDFSVRNHPAGEHGFDVLNDDDLSRDIIRQAFEFLNRVLVRPA